MFDDPDSVEREMSVRVEEMNPDQLVTYVMKHQAASGLVLAVEGYQERAIFKALQRIYGQRTAGRIIKWVFYHHKGVHDGQPVRFTTFSAKRKWWVDQMHLEMQQHERRTSSYKAVPADTPTTVRVIKF